MRSELRDRQTAITICCGLAAMAILSVPLGGGAVEQIVRVVVGVPLVFVLPGHAILLATRPASIGTAADVVVRVERWAWAIAVSIGAAVLGAFFLNFLPSGLTRTNWLILLGATTVLAGAFATARGRLSRGASDREPVGTRARTARAVVHDRRTVAALAGAAVVMAVAVWIGVSSAAGVPYQGFAELWLVPSATASAAVAGGDRTHVSADIGVYSLEERDRRFRLELRADDGVLVQSWAFDLGPGAQWRQHIDLARSRTFTAQLYRDAEQTPYRRVWLSAG